MANVSLKYTDIISQFDGNGNFPEWLDKLELVAKLQNVKNMESFLPLFFIRRGFSSVSRIVRRTEEQL